MARPDLTILHLAGLRFGASRSPVGLTDADQGWSSLAARLLDDLSILRSEQAVEPDLVVVAGDLAESAMPTEYQEAHAFLTQMRDGLALESDRLVIVPGRHDVNVRKGQAYALDREAEGEAAVPPYWPKWEPFAKLYAAWCGVGFPMDQPWSYVEFPVLRLAVAGLNSTMPASHLDPDGPGGLGEDQLRYVADRMTEAAARGWRCVAVLNHSPVALRDADRFDEVLAPQLDLVLHGGPHGQGVDHTGPDAVTVLGTSVGDAEAPDRYRVVQVFPDRVRIWARRFEPSRRRWVGDTAVSPDGDVWWREIPARVRAMAMGDTPNVPWRVRVGPRDLGRDDLLTRIAEVCQLRLPHATVREVVQTDPLWRYLHVSEPRDVAVEQYPIGVCDGPASRDSIERFLADVDAFYRIGPGGPGSKLVYHGPPAGPELREWAALRGVDLVSFAEYQMGYDLRPYSRRQAEELGFDPAYPPSLYVAQRYLELDGHGRRLYDEPRAAVIERMRVWLAEPDGHLVVVLAPFGHGKTFLLRELARRMHADGDPAVPVLVQLRDLEKSHRLDELVAAQLTRGGERRIDLTLFRYLLREGRIALLFDGFDELALRVSYDRAADHLATIINAAAGRAKVVLTSRDHHFLTDLEVATAMGDQLSTVAGRRLVKLAGFDPAQVQEFLTRHLGDAGEAARRFNLLEEVRDLSGLAANPRMLGFITGIDEDRLRAARERTGTITSATLYYELLDQWLEREHGLFQQTGSPSTQDLWYAVTDLALRLWRSGEDALALTDLTDTAAAMAALAARVADPSTPDLSQNAQLFGARTLLIRPDEERFAFVHQSVMEWLVCHHLADQFKTGGGDLEALRRPISPLMVDFLEGLTDPADLAAWVLGVLAGRDAPAELRENALLLQGRLGIDARAPLSLPSYDLRGQDLAGRDLRDADLRGANLSGVRLNRADVTGADLTDAVLRGAHLNQANLSHVMLRGADLTGARLLGARFAGANLLGAVLRRAALVGVVGAGDTLKDTDSIGAARTGSAPEPQIAATTSSVHALAFDDRGELLVTGSGDGVVRVWDVEAGLLVREVRGHTGAVLSVSFSPDGRWLASSGDDETVRLWDADTGRLVRELSMLTGRLRWVGFSSDGRWLASAGANGAVRVWETATGDVVVQLVGPPGVGQSMRFSPSGPWLASAGADGVVRVWDVRAGRLAYQLAGHTGVVRSVAFSADGQWLASAGAEGVVLVWDASSGRLVRELSGHPGGVWSVGFSPDDRSLLSAGADQMVRVWNVATGRLVRELCGHRGPVRLAVFSPDGRWMASAGDDGTVQVWDADGETLVRELYGYSQPVWTVAFSPDGRWLASAGADGIVRMRDTNTGVVVREWSGHGGRVQSVGFSPDGRWLASAGADATVRLRDARTGQEIRELAGHPGAVWTMRFSPDGRLLASAGAGGLVRMWDPDTGTVVKEFARHPGWIWSVGFSADGKQLASAGNDGMVRMWDLETGLVVDVMSAHTGAVWAAAFSPTGHLLASAGDDGLVRIWDPRTGKVVRDLSGHTGRVLALAFAPDGRSLASAGDDGIVRVWDPSAGTVRCEAYRHTRAIWTVAFSADGQWLASAGDDRMVRVWNAATGEPRYGLLTLADGGWAVLLPDGRYKLEGTPDGEFWYTINMCRFEPGELDPYVPSVTRLRADAPI